MQTVCMRYYPIRHVFRSNGVPQARRRFLGTSTMITSTTCGSSCLFPTKSTPTVSVTSSRALTWTSLGVSRSSNSVVYRLLGLIFSGSAAKGTLIIGFHKTDPGENQKWIIKKETSGTGFWKYVLVCAVRDRISLNECKGSRTRRRRVSIPLSQ